MESPQEINDHFAVSGLKIEKTDLWNTEPHINKMTDVHIKDEKVEIDEMELHKSSEFYLDIKAIIKSEENTPIEGDSTDTTGCTGNQSCVTEDFSDKSNKNGQSSSQLVFLLKCNLCDYCSDSEGRFVEHILIHSPSEFLKCPFCEYNCSDGRNFMEHIKNHRNRNVVEDHITINISERMFKSAGTQECVSECTKKGNLKHYLRTQSEEKLFKCNFCDYSCVRRLLWKQHLKSHTDKKPFKCKVCEYASISKTRLKNHMRTHAGEKPFKCNICEYASSYKTNL